MSTQEKNYCNVSRDATSLQREVNNQKILKASEYVYDE